MQDRIDEQAIGTARVLMLIMAEDVLENLAHGCRVRDEQLFQLAVCGWTEEAFVLDATEWVLGHE